MLDNSSSLFASKELETGAGLKDGGWSCEGGFSPKIENREGVVGGGMKAFGFGFLVGSAKPPFSSRF